jgi:hypothetical protein
MASNNIVSPYGEQGASLTTHDLRTTAMTRFPRILLLVFLFDAPIWERLRDSTQRQLSAIGTHPISSPVSTALAALRRCIPRRAVKPAPNFISNCPESSCAPC